MGWIHEAVCSGKNLDALATQLLRHYIQDFHDAFRAAAEQVCQFAGHRDRVAICRAEAPPGLVNRRCQLIQALPERAGQLNRSVDASVGEDAGCLEMGTADIPADDAIS